MLMPKILIDTGRSRLWIVENYSPDLMSEMQTLKLQEEPPIIVGGRECRQRRNVGFFSDESIGYRYSGQIMYSSPLSEAPILQTILPQINSALGTSFNGVLVNSYLTGEKYLSAHSDDEKGLEKGRNMVVGIAYGATRIFRIRDKTNKKIVLDYQHIPGTLLVMEGDFQKEFTHEIPQQKKIKDERISITFRHHIE